VEPSSAPWRVLETTEPAPRDPTSGPRGRPWIAIAAALVAIAIVGVAALAAAQPQPVIGIDGAADLGAGAIEAGWPRSTASGSGSLGSPGPDVVVEVGGAVARPGVYRLAPGARICDAVAAAGGYGPSVDVGEAERTLNLAAPVRDGDKIHVPVRGEASPSQGPATTGGASGDGAGTGDGGVIDVNRATAEQLDTLPGVGPATAAKIIAAREERPFTSVDELGSRKVVGAATLAKIRALVTVGP
jgi:competence protein ComEA